MIYLHMHYWIPEKIDVVKLQDMQEYMISVAKMQGSIESSDGYLVIFNTIEEHLDDTALEEMSTGLVLFAEFKDGVIYAAP